MEQTHRFKVGDRVIVGEEVFTILQLTVVGNHTPGYFMREQEGRFRDSDCHSAEFLKQFQS